mmetsp:Transcript_52482/g.86883  ORF Transcript_52482/g.86883 Transcript_52482/m.86883 type:complete len:204 (-) Transcript_52482:142-753(-)
MTPLQRQLSVETCTILINIRIVVLVIIIIIIIIIGLCVYRDIMIKEGLRVITKHTDPKRFHHLTQQSTKMHKLLGTNVSLKSALNLWEITININRKHMLQATLIALIESIMHINAMTIRFQYIAFECFTFRRLKQERTHLLHKLPLVHCHVDEIRLQHFLLKRCKLSTTNHTRIVQIEFTLILGIICPCVIVIPLTDTVAIHR